jgi:hypothetical protein
MNVAIITTVCALLHEVGIIITNRAWACLIAAVKTIKPIFTLTKPIATDSMIAAVV